MLGLGPFGKVPVVILPDGERLWDSRAILDHLHGDASSERALLPREEPERRKVIRAEVTALGLAEKAYERGIAWLHLALSRNGSALGLVRRNARSLCSVLFRNRGGAQRLAAGDYVTQRVSNSMVACAIA
jgi:glutathione S-transferase